MNSKPHVLFLSYDGMTDPLGQSQVIPYLVGLTAYGYRFAIISCDKPQKYTAHKEDVERQLQGYPVSWHSIPYHKSPPVLSSVYDLFKMKQLIKKLHKKDPFQMVHARTGLPSVAALWMKKKYGISFLNDIRGFWADERVDGAMWNLANPVYKTTYRFFKKNEKRAIELADYSNCLTYAAQKEILSWKNIKGQPRPISVVPCSVDLQLFDPGNIDEVLKDHFRRQLQFTGNEMVVSYLGSVGGWYLADEMMRFNKQLYDQLPGTIFLFISPDRHEAILQSATNAGIPADRIRVVKARRHEVPVLLSFSNYSVFFIKPCYSKIASSPTKHGEIMAMGIPVITNAGVGDVKEIVLQNDAGYVVNDFSPAAFDEVIHRIRFAKAFSAEKIRAAAIKTYSLNDAVKTYAAVYKTILGS